MSRTIVLPKEFERHPIDVVGVDKTNNIVTVTYTWDPGMNKATYAWIDNVFETHPKADFLKFYNNGKLLLTVARD